MASNRTNPTALTSNSTTAVTDHGQEGLEEKTRSNSTSQASIDLTKDNPKPTSKKTPTTTTTTTHKKRSPKSNKTDVTKEATIGVKMAPLFRKKFYMSTMKKKYEKAWDPEKEKFGNSAFTTWMGNMEDPRLQKCPGYWASTPDDEKFTYAEVAGLLFNEIQNVKERENLPVKDVVMDDIRVWVQGTFDSDEVDDDSIWRLRRYLLSIAIQCPTVVFDLTSAQQKHIEGEAVRFWDFSTAFDPAIRIEPEEPLTWMWLAVTEFFAHPWTGPDIPPPVVEEFERLQREHEKSKQQRRPQKKRPASTPKNPKGPKSTDTRPSPTRPMEIEQATLAKEKARTFFAPHQRSPPEPGDTPKRANNVSIQEQVHVIAGSPAVSQEIEPSGDPTAAEPTGTSSNPEGQDEADEPTYSEVASRPAATPLTTDEKLKKLTQVRWNGTTFQHIYIYNVSVGFEWQGNGSTKFSLIETAYEAFRRFAVGMWNGGINSKVVLLPFSDGRFTQRQLWVRNMQEFNKLIPDWEHLKTYIDPNFGNPYILNKADKKGTKVYKTRMRVGFDNAPPIVMQELRQLLSTTRGAGVFPTPIQRSQMTRIGFFPLWPAEMYLPPICKELMRLCGFRYPIGLMMEWVNNPRDFSAKFSTNARGLQLWHAFVPSEFAREADKLLSFHIDQRKPRSGLPFNAPTHYVTDWQAANDGLVSVRQSPQLRRVITKLRERSRAMKATSCVLDIPIECPGMLQVAETENYGALSLLRFLLSIVVTPVQAKKAADASEKSPGGTSANNSSTSESSGEDSDTNNGPSRPFAWTSVIRKTVAPTPKPETKPTAPPAPTTAEEMDDWVQQLAAIDLSDDEPSPLFIMVLPNEVDDEYFVVVRQRYEALALNVLNNLPAFLKFHLRELSFNNFLKVLSKWTATDLARRNQLGNIVWFPGELRTRCVDNPTDQPTGPKVADPLAFLLRMEDPSEILEGTLHIDVNSDNARDVDDGLTVIGALDDLKEREEQLLSALQTIDVMQDAHTELELKHQALLDRLAALEASSPANPGNVNMTTPPESEPMDSNDAHTTEVSGASNSQTPSRGGISSTTGE
jgi:hypothetical protein